jgi:hypothetical protein
MQVEVVAALIMHLVDRAASVEMVAVAMAALTPLDLLEL